MKLEGKLQLEGINPYIHHVIIDSDSSDAIMKVCKKYRAALKDCKIVKDAKDKSIYVFIDDKSVIKAYFWFI